MEICPSCGQENPEGFRLCGMCGTPLAASLTAVRQERKFVTVLFADLVGFTSTSEVLDPEDVGALLVPYYARLRSELEIRGGSVEKFIGDAVMAVFGAPVAHEDDPERAVRSALAIRDWAEDESVDLRIGINTGEALVRLDARPEEGQAIATGDVVNTAARLQSAAPIGGILVGEQTQRGTDRAIDYEAVEPIAAKGKTQPVPAWLALGARARISVERVHGAALVGRTREVDLLAGALDRIRQERSPQLVTLVGVPGIGKSRLVLELFNRIEQEAEITTWRQGRCLPYGEGVTFWALGEMVKAQAGILEGDGAAAAEQKLHAVADDPWIESHLRPLVGLAGGAEGGGDRRDEAFTAWRRFFEGLAEQRPLVLVFEDLHWADKNLLDFIDHLVDWASGVSLLVVCTARPELLARRQGWGGGKPNALTISLSPLTDDETARLLAELLERALLPAETQAELLERAGGNPLYAEEYARMLRERGRVAELPENVQGMIAARLDLLEPEQKALLQQASVIGRTFWLGALGSLTDEEPGSLERRLHELDRKEFVRRERTSSLANDVECTFRHLLVRDVAYGQIPRGERVEMHRRAAQWLEGLGRADDYAEMLAHHYMEALELAAAAGVQADTFLAPALTALAHAGDRAYALNAYDAAVRYYRTALDLLPEDDQRQGRLRFRLGRSLFQIGQSDVPMLERAAELSYARGDIEGATDVERTLAEHFWMVGNRDRALRHLEQARSLADRLPASPGKAHTLGTASRLYFLASRDEEAIRLGFEALVMAEELGLDEVRAAVLDNVGCAHLNLGQVEEGLAEIRQAIQIAAAAGAPWELCRAKGNLAAQLWCLGETTQAKLLWEQASVESTRYGQLGFARWFQGIHVQVQYSLGRWDQALAAGDQFLAEVEGGSPHYLAGEVYITRALIRLGRGHDQGALEDAEAGLAAARRAGDPQAVYPALAAVAHVLSGLDRHEQARPLAEEFLAVLSSGERIGFGVVWAHILAWTLTAIGRGGDLAAALEQYDQPWARAGSAYARGDPTEAAEICAGLGALSEEAYARLGAARMLTDQGRAVEAQEHLRRAGNFYRSVGAVRYEREVKALLAQPA